ncbi:MAG: hypothetical protein U0324_45390 [Polyangiales bacterium]
MPLDRLSISRGFIATMKGVDASVRARVYKVAEALADEHPDLPGPRDVEVRLAPVGTCWARAVPGTIWSVLYTVGAEKVYVRSANVL